MKKSEIATLYKLYVDDMFNYAIYLGFEKEMVMDAIHDIFCKLAVDEKLLQNVSNIKFYLFKSLKNRIFDIYRSQKENITINDVDTQNAPFNITVTIEDRIISKEEQEKIKNQISEMLNSLTDRQREIVYLRYVQEYDYLQIAELLNISVHGCRKLLSKAMQNLREKYGTLILLLLLS